MWCITIINIDVIVEAYSRLGSIWKVGAELGLCGQRIHQRLSATGFVFKEPEFTLAQAEIIRKYYSDTPSGEFSLDYLADVIGKHKTNICRFARRNGFSDQNRRESDKTIAHLKTRKWAPGTHPRGMLGKRHTPETKAIIGMKSRQLWTTWAAFHTGQMSEESRQILSDRMSKQMAARPAHTIHSRSAYGRRSDLDNMFFRSSWEANYARYLNLLQKIGLIEYWKYESKTFWFEAIKRGVRSYKPDFEVLYKGDKEPTFIEIKGWVVPKDGTKAARMRKYYPNVRLVRVGATEYRAIEQKWRSAIPTWEKPAQKKRIRHRGIDNKNT